MYLTVRGVGIMTGRSWSRLLVRAGGLVLSLFLVVPAGVVPTITSNTTAKIRVHEAYAGLPLYFEANQGQTDPQAQFLSRGPGYTLFLTSTEAVLVLMKREPSAPEPAALTRPGPRGPAAGTVLRMTFVGANPQPRVAGREELPGKVNYFIGNDPTKWRANLPTYAKVRYDDLYPGIDLVYYGNQRHLEYDLVVRPGADPTQIGLGVEGADHLEVDARGDLVLHTALGPVRQHKPVIYQEVDRLRREVAGSYVLRGSQQVGFQVAAYDRSRPLVIDPTLFYSTYLGGGFNDSGHGIAVDAIGNAYVTGLTHSADFPTTTGAFDTTASGLFDAFVTKLNPTGSAPLVYSTYLGGDDTDQGNGIAVDAMGNVYVTGLTLSADFPTTADAFDTTFNGFFDAFVTKLNPSGSAPLVYSTYLGGVDRDTGRGIAVDAMGDAYVTGDTFSSDFPTTADAFDTTFNGFFDAFVTKLNPSGTAPLVYSTYLGGVDRDTGRGIAVDVAGNAYVTGETGGSGFPTTPLAFDTTLGGSIDAFVTKLNPTGSAPLVYSTYLGGSDFEEGLAIAVDAMGNAYVTGDTGSSDFPTTTGAFDTTLSGSSDAFVTKLNPTGTAPLVYSTYLGGSGGETGYDIGYGIAVDAMGNAYVTGDTRSSDFPTTAGAFDSTLGGCCDAFATKLNPTGSAPLVYSTYLGGSDFEDGLAIAVDALENAYVTGQTNSADFPTTMGAFDTAYNGEGDAFVAKIIDVVLPPGPTEGKVTGGGSINVPNGTGTFGLIVQQQAADSSIHGHLQYVNHATKTKVRSVMFTTFMISGNMATFSGTCTSNDLPCTFRVDVMDNDEPGTSDSFTIRVNAGPPEGGTLRGGNIQIHQ